MIEHSRSCCAPGVPRRAPSLLLSLSAIAKRHQYRGKQRKDNQEEVDPFYSSLSIISAIPCTTHHFQRPSQLRTPEFVATSQEAPLDNLGVPYQDRHWKHFEALVLTTDEFLVSASICGPRLASLFTCTNDVLLHIFPYTNAIDQPLEVLLPAYLRQDLATRRSAGVR